MPNRKARRANKSASPGRASAATLDAPAPYVLALVWSAIAAYLVLFYWTPLASVQAVSDKLVRRWDILLGLFYPDEFVRAWFQDASWAALGQRATILATAGAILAVACAAGWLCLRLAGLDRRMSRLETFVFTAGVGLNLVSLVTLALGLAGVMQWWVVAAMGCAVLGVAGVVRWKGGGPPAESGAKRRDVDASFSPPVSSLQPPAFLFLYLALPFVLVIVLGAMLPPLDFDVREYHSQAPKEFYQQGRITFLAHNVYANMPLGSEMLSLVGMIVCGDWWLGALVGKTLIALFAPLAALALVAAGSRFVTPTAGVIAALVYISTPWIARVSMNGLVEGAMAFYLFAALLAVMMWQQDRTAARSDDKFLWVSGFLAGAAVSTKYPAVVFCVVPLATWIVYRSVAGNGDQTNRPAAASVLRPLATFLVFVALGCGLWLAKNAYFTGNPVYPLLYDVFGGQTRTAENDDKWTRAHEPPNYRPSDLAARAVDVTLTSDWLSPLLMPLAALGLLFGRRRLVWWLAAYIVFVIAAWWLFTHRIDRFWVPILPLVALAAGVGATWTATRWWRIPFVALLVLGLLSNLVVITSPLVADNRYLADLNVLREDPYRIDPWHLYLNEHADDVSRVLLVGDAQPFDLEVPATYNTVFDDNIFERLARGHTSQEVQQALNDRKISHVYVNWKEVARYRSPGNYGFTKFIAPEVFDRLVKDGVLARLPLMDDDRNELYRVLPASPKRAGDHSLH